MTGTARPPHTQHRETETAGILDLFEEYAYAGEIRPDGSYVDHASWPTLRRVLGGPVPEGTPAGELWESRIDRADWPAYQQYNRTLLGGEDAEVTYRLHGLDGVTRVLSDRARPTPRATGGVFVHGIISDVTQRAEADARAAEASERFSRLLDVVGEHVYLAQGFPDGTLKELFQGPGADRLLGGAEPDAEMENWDAAVHPEDRAAYHDFNAALARGEAGDVEYRLIGADGVTRWVHDRAATRAREDGTFEVSGIVADVTERRRMRAELALAHAALSRVVEALDDHLYTLEVLPGGAVRDVYRGPNRDALTGGPLPADGRTWDAFVHPADRARWRQAMARLPEGEPSARVPGPRARRRGAHRARPPAPAERAGRAPLRRRDARHHRDAPPRGRAAPRPGRGRAARTDRRADRRVQPAPLRRAGLRGARGRGPRARPADPRRRPLQAGQRPPWARGRGRRARRAGAAARAGLGPGDASPAGAARSSRSCSRAWLRRGARAARGAPARGDRPRAGRRRGGGRAADHLGRRGARGAGLDTLDALVETADRCLYVAKREGRDRVSLVPHLTLRVA